MKVDYSVIFRTLHLPDDGERTLKAYLMWVKAHHAIWKAFPDVNQSGYYKRIQLFGLQPFWTTTWYDRFTTTATLGESGTEINDCWAALLLYHLDILWSQLDNISDTALDQLTVIHRCTNRIKGARLYGLGIAAKCLDPDRISGFLDLYEDIATNEELHDWIALQFLPKSATSR